MRIILAECRRRGMLFDDAWVFAMKSVTWPHDTVHRRQWREALRSTRSEWRASYLNMPTRTALILKDFDPTILFAEDGISVAA